MLYGAHWDSQSNNIIGNTTHLSVRLRVHLICLMKTQCKLKVLDIQCLTRVRNSMYVWKCTYTHTFMCTYVELYVWMEIRAYVQ
jgi:hypothetical protein